MDRSAYWKAYEAANKEKIAARKKQWRIDNKAARSAYYKAYAETPEGKAGNAAREGKRRAAKMNRTMSWTETKDIAELYAFCQKLDDHHVDHIIPLQGKLVSGLHVYDNLQIIPAAENHSKNNKFKAGAL